MDKNRTIDKWILKLMITFIIIVFVVATVVLGTESTISSGRADVYKGTWERIFEDGSREPISLSDDLDVKGGQPYVIETRIPKNTEHGEYICFRSSHQCVNVYVNGSLQTKYDTTEEFMFGNNTASRYLFTKVNPDDVVRYELVSNSEYAGVLSEAYIGDTHSIWLKLLLKVGGSAIFGFILLAFGVLIVIVSKVLGKILCRKIYIDYLGWMIIFVGIWNLFESRVRQVYLFNASVGATLAFLCTICASMSIFIYIDNIQNRRYKNNYIVAEVILLVDFVVIVLLHLTKTLDVVQSMYINYAVNLIAILIMLWTLISDWRLKKIQEYKFVAYGIICVVIASIVELGVGIAKLINITGVSLSIGVLILLFLCGWQSVIDLLEEEKQHQRSLAEAETKDIFLARMSHELRTPLNAILGMDELILREATEAEVQDYAKNIQRAGNMLLGLVNDILDFSKIGSGKMDILPEEYEVRDLILDVHNLIDKRAKEKQLEFVIEADSCLPKKLHGDIGRIKQVAMNLLTNAVKYTNEGRVTWSLQCEEVEQRNVLRMKVSDTGQGIREENIPILFESFSRLEEKSNKNIEGTGLGLSITKSLVELMGGTIVVESEFGNGSTFCVAIPQKIVDASPMGEWNKRSSNKVEEYQSRLCIPDKRILVVDDNEINLMIVENLLLHTQAEIVTVQSGEKAIAYCKEQDFDVIFMDHMMPNKDGIETLHELREYWGGKKKTPVIALTANAVSGMKEMYLNEGFTGYLSKPISGTQLEEMIMKVTGE